MELALILPRCYNRTEDAGDKLLLPPLNLPILGAGAPPGVKVTILDDRLEKIDYTKKYNLVGITCITETATRAYQIADNFRKNKVPVILGGIHPTLNRKEAAQHADSVFLGEAFGKKWENVFADLKKGELAKVYDNLLPEDLSEMPFPDNTLLPKHFRYLKRIHLINATRGCYMRCTFCSTQEFWKGKVRARPVEQVVTEIKKCGKKIIAFVDDDLGGDKKYARKLFKALIPLNIYWVTQTRINLCLDEELLALASESGCAALFVGFESISSDSLSVIKKHQNKIADYNKAVNNCHKNRIIIEAGFVFGFDHDHPTIFQDTLNYILSSKLDSININILHPIPGTEAFCSIENSGRLITRDWSKWSSVGKALYRPALMSPKDLEGGANWLLRRIYTRSKIMKRTIRSLLWVKGSLWTFVLLQNLNYRTRRAIAWGKGYNPAANMK